jgi:hypothetical protein
MKNHFSIREAIRFGWHKVKEHSGLIFQLVLALFALQVVTAIVQKVLENTALGSLAGFALAVLSTFVGTGVMLITLKLARGDHAQFNQILPEWRLVWKYFCSGVIVGVLSMLPIAVGALLAFALVSAYVPHFAADLFASQRPGDVLNQAIVQLQGTHPMVLISISVIVAVAIVSAVYLGLRYSMARYAVVDGAGIIESVRQSAKLTRGAKWNLVGFIAALILLNIVGAIALLVGLLVTIPITMLATAHVYLKLKARHS